MSRLLRLARLLLATPQVTYGGDASYPGGPPSHNLKITSLTLQDLPPEIQHQMTSGLNDIVSNFNQELENYKQHYDEIKKERGGFLLPLPEIQNSIKRQLELVQADIARVQTGSFSVKFQITLGRKPFYYADLQDSTGHPLRIWPPGNSQAAVNGGKLLAQHLMKTVPQIAQFIKGLEVKRGMDKSKFKKSELPYRDLYRDSDYTALVKLVRKWDSALKKWALKEYGEPSEDIYLDIKAKKGKVTITSATRDALEGTHMELTVNQGGGFTLEDFDYGKCGFFGRAPEFSPEDGVELSLKTLDKIFSHYYQIWTGEKGCDDRDPLGGGWDNDDDSPPLPPSPPSPRVRKRELVEV
jgi:hypothetical protein